jgi:hypothetical protein
MGYFHRRRYRARLRALFWTISMNTEYQTLVAECAEQGKALMRMLANDGTIEPLYLYCRHGEPGKSGRLFLVRDSAPVPPGVQLVTGEGLRSNVPYEHYFTWVFDRAKRAPILAY